MAHPPGRTGRAAGPPDRIEFSRDLRTGDVAAEVAFLAMDLEADGFAADAAAFIDAAWHWCRNFAAGE